jgi:hypothetical protein
MAYAIDRQPIGCLRTCEQDMEAQPHDKIIQVYCPAFVAKAVTEVAARELISASAYVRQAIVAQLRNDGVQLTIDQ